MRKYNKITAEIPSVFDVLIEKLDRLHTIPVY